MTKTCIAKMAFKNDLYYIKCANKQCPQARIKQMLLKTNKQTNNTHSLNTRTVMVLKKLHKPSEARVSLHCGAFH